jgi:hypothetical protein
MTESSANSPVVPKVSVDWFRATPWWRLASQSVVISWRSSHVLLCAAAILATSAVVNLSAYLFGIEEMGAESVWGQPSGGNTMLGPSFFSDNPINVLESTYGMYLSPVYSWLASPTLNGTSHAVASMIGIIAIWSFVGGCIARRSVVELGTNMTATWTDVLMLVKSRWQSIAWSMTMPSGVIFLLMLMPLVIGWISNIPAIGPWIAGLLLIPTVFFSIAIGWCAAITIFGFPLSVCAIVSEKKADAYDGVSRSAAYTFQRPVTLVLCVVVAQWFGSVVGQMVIMVYGTGYKVIGTAFDIGSFSSLNTLDTFWGEVVRGIIPLLISAFCFSYFWTVSSATYLILRRDVDHTEFDSIDMNVASEPKALPDLPNKESIEKEAKDSNSSPEPPATATSTTEST